MTHRLVPLIPILILLLLLVAGCTSTPRRASGPEETVTPAEQQAGYQAEPGRDAATVAQMRAAPSPASPMLEPGEASVNDETRLTAQGYVRIGTGRYPTEEAAAREAALRQGQQVGAERVLFHLTRDADKQAWIAHFYVRFKLPFGASFRDLRAQEREQLGRDGGVEIGSVVSGTPASRANLIAGDFVLELDGQPIADRAAFQNLLKRSAGRSVTLTIVRNGETLKRMVRLGAMPGADH
jgi:membrane-associated protease RseP (regulator of RpoE activity)